MSNNPNTQNLGDFTPQGNRIEMPNLVFTFYGVEYRVGKRYNTIAWLRFAEAMNAASIRKTDSIREMGEFGALIRKVVVPEQTEDFLDAIEEADMEQDDLMHLLNKILEAVAARPTNRPSVSSAGQPTTSASLTERSSGDQEVTTVTGTLVAS